MGLLSKDPDLEQSDAAPGDRYEAVVNKKDINMRRFTAGLNARWKNGWRLAHIFEQSGNTVMVFERRDQ